MLIARQLDLLKDLELDGRMDLASIGRHTLMAFEEARALFAQEIDRIRSELAPERP